MHSRQGMSRNRFTISQQFTLQAFPDAWKRQLILGIFLSTFVILPSSHTVLYAQPVYQASDFARIGDGQLVSTTYNYLGQFDFAATGADYTWDFSQLRLSTQQELSYVDPFIAGYSTTWCQVNDCHANCKEIFKSNFNLALVRTDSFRAEGLVLSNVVDHFQKTDAAFVAKMIGGTFNLNGKPVQVIADYSDADTIYHFPLEYGQEDHSTGRFTIDMSHLGMPATYASSTRRFNRVDGWGSLTTPFLTYPSVLKMQTMLIRNDTLMDNGQITIDQDTLIRYTWFDPHFSIPVLLTNGYLKNGKIRMTEATYFGSFHCRLPTAQFTYMPQASIFNPDENNAKVFFSNYSINADSFYWEFDDGAHYNNINVVHTYDQPGIKEVKLKVYNSLCDPIIVDSMSIPVIVLDTSTTRVNYQVETICLGDSIYLQQAYRKQGGIYYDTLPPMGGYGRLRITTLRINRINTELTIKFNTIASRELDATYQWFNCTDQYQSITGATDRLFTPEVDGTFAVEVAKHGCLDTSDCYVMVTSSTEKTDPPALVRLYPNPTQDFVQIDLKEAYPELQLSLFSLQGILVQQQKIHHKTSIRLDLGQLENGMYLLVLTDQNGYSGVPIKLIKY